jgi:hypothetical protein
MFKTIMFLLAVLLSYSCGMAFARMAHAEGHRSHRTSSNHRANATQQSTNDSTVFARGERFHTIVQFCRENPDHCVHVGNTYFLQ